MKKRVYVVVLLLITLLLTGCKLNQNDGKERLYLSNNYYNSDGKYIEVSNEELLDKQDETYVLFTYNNYCNLSVPCDQIFEVFMKKYKIDFLSIPYEDFKETTLHDTVLYAPSVIIVSEGKIIAYLDAESDEDLIRYTDANEFEKWLDKYVYFRSKK